MNRMANVIAQEGLEHRIAVITVEPGFVLTETMATTFAETGVTDTETIPPTVPAAAIAYLCTCDDPMRYTGEIVSGPALVGSSDSDGSRAQVRGSPGSNWSTTAISMPPVVSGSSTSAPAASRNTRTPAPSSATRAACKVVDPHAAERHTRAIVGATQARGSRRATAGRARACSRRRTRRQPARRAARRRSRTSRPSRTCRPDHARR